MPDGDKRKRLVSRRPPCIGFSRPRSMPVSRCGDAVF